jgi:hypothetical protein
LKHGEVERALIQRAACDPLFSNASPEQHRPRRWNGQLQARLRDVTLSRVPTGDPTIAAARPFRLKPYNLGAVLRLQAEDLLIAQYFPTNVGVHLAKLIVAADGHAEFAEYLTRPPRPSRFQHHSWTLTAEPLDSLGQRLAALGPLDREVAFERFEDWESTEYEEPLRRSVRYWHGGSRTASFLPTDALVQKAAGDRHLAANYRRAFEAAWETIAEVMDAARAATGDL